jgi:hypothetical protein
LSRPRFLADQDFDEHILHAVLRCELAASGGRIEHAPLLEYRDMSMCPSAKETDSLLG